MKHYIDSDVHIEFYFEKCFNEEKGDWTNFPICSEKLLHYLIKCLMESERFMLNSKEDFEKEINEKLVILEKRLNLEHLLKTTLQINNFNNLKNDIKKRSFLSGVENLKSILSSIRHFDLLKFFSLSEINKEAIDIVENKNVYLLFGQTGVGKSTTLHFLAGSKMKEQNINGKLHILPENVSNPDLKDVKTGISAIKSETCSVIPVRIFHNEDEVLFCDLPGFGDRNGAETDISNSIAINNCIQNCKGIKPILCISYNNGDRLELFKSLADILKGMFSDLKHYIDYFDYIFTKYPNEEKTQLKQQIEKIKNELEKQDKKEEPFYVIIEGILNKSKNGLKVISPVEDDYKSLLDSLITNSFITRPSKFINVSFSFESFSKLEKQIKFEFEFITNILLEFVYNNSLNERELVLFKVKQLVELRELVKNNFINELYDQCSEELVKIIFDDINIFINNFNKKIEINDLINEYDKTVYLSFLDKTEFCDDILTSLNVKKVFKHDEVKNNLYEKLTCIINSLNGLDLVTHTELMQKKLNNMFFVENIINCFDPSGFFTNFCNKLKESLKKLIESYLTIIDQSSDFAEILKCFSSLKKIKDLLGQHLDISINYYDRLKDQFLEKLKNADYKSERILIRTILEKKDIDELNNINEILKLAHKCVDLHQHIDVTLIKSIYRAFLDKIFNYFKEKKNYAVLFISESLSKLSECSMNINDFNRNICNLFTQMIDLRSNQEFQEITGELFNECENVLLGFIEQISTGIKKSLYEHKTGHKKIDKIVYLARCMHKLNWTKDLNKFYYENEHKSVDEAIFNFVESTKEELFNTDMSFDDTIIFEKIKDLTRLEKISNQYQNLEPTINEVKNWFLVQLNIKLDCIKEFFDKLCHLNMNYDYIEASILFLDKIKSSKISFVPYEVDNVRIYIVNKLNDAFDMVKQEIKNEFKSLQTNNFQIKKLRIYLEEQWQINQNFPKIKKCLNFNIEKYVDDNSTTIMDTYHEYEFKLGYLNKPKELVKLNENILFLNELSKLDRFIVDKEKCFSKLNERYLLNFFNVINIIESDSVRLINEHGFNKTLCNYFNIFSSLDKSAQINYERIIGIIINRNSALYNLEDLFDKLKNLLNKSLLDILIKCKTHLFQLYDLEREVLEKASIEFDKVNLAKENLQEYLDLNQISKFEREIKKLAQDFVDRCLSSIKKLMKQFEAHGKIEKFKNCKIFLDSFSIDLDQINDYIDNEEDYVSKALDEFDIYDIVDYVEFKVFPKEIYQNLKKSNYITGIFKFKKIIFEKYKIMLAELEEKKQYDRDYYINGLKLYKKSLKRIPDDLNLNEVIWTDIEMDEENQLKINFFALFFCFILVCLLIYYLM